MDEETKKNKRLSEAESEKIIFLNQLLQKGKEIKSLRLRQGQKQTGVYVVQRCEGWISAISKERKKGFTFFITKVCDIEP